MDTECNDKFLTLLKKNRRQCDRLNAQTLQIDTERARLKRKLQNDDAYDEGSVIITEEEVVAKPMSLVLYEMKHSDDPRLVYSDLVSRGRHQLTVKRQKKWCANEAEAYLKKQPECELLDWQQNAMAAIDARESDTANIGSKGVMLCLDMGLGKTIITLAYILYDNQRCFRQTGSRYNGCTLIPVPGKLLIDGWITEALTKWPANSFEYHVLYSSKNRQISRVYIENCCDFMLVTYATIKAAYRYKYGDGDEDDEEEDDDSEESDNEGEGEEPVKVNKARAAQEYKYEILYRTQWKRIVPDESHHFVNEKTRLFKAMMALKSDIKWVVTGTPIQNKLSDICASFNFIGIPQSVNRDVDITDEEKAQIKETLKVVMIRKLKSELNGKDSKLVMMPIVKTIKLIEFESIQEKAIYYMYATYGTRHLRESIGDHHHQQKNSNNIASILQLMIQLCIGMRIVKDLVLPRGLLTLGDEEELQLKETLYKEELFNDEDAEQLYSPNDNTLEYYGSHFDKKTTLGYKSSSVNNLVNIPDGYHFEYTRSLHTVKREGEEADEPSKEDSFVWDPFRVDPNFDLSPNCTEDRAEYQRIYDTLCSEGIESAHTLRTKKNSRKTRAMVKHLMERTLRMPHYSSKNRHIIRYIQEIPLDDKAIVFSNSIRGLECLANDLSLHGLDVIMVNGTTKDNTERIREFKEGPVRVLLLSFKLGNVGLNITCANHIIFMHPWWNPHMVEQAADRVHRLGQRKTVYIVHFIMNHTIDLYVLNLSHDKKFMTSSMMSTQSLPMDRLVLAGDTKKEKERYAYNLYEYSISQ